MINGKTFVDVLMKINYPDAEKLSGSSFDYMFEHFELLPFLESFCNTIGEENVVTSEELAALDALPPDDIFEGYFEEALLPVSVKHAKEEISDEISYLKAELHTLTKNNEILGQQISNLRSQQVNLVKKTEEIERLLSCQRKKYGKLQDEDVPSTERKVAADLEHMISHVQIMESLLSKPGDSQMSSSSKTFFQMNLGPYLKVENAALDHIHSYISMSLNEGLIQNQRRLSYDPGDGLYESTVVSKASSGNSDLSLLMENLKVSEEAFLGVSYQRSKADASLKFYKENFDLNRYLQASSILCTNTEEAQETLKRFKQEENRLLSTVPEVVQEYIQMECNWISVLYYRENLADCASLLMKQKMPLNLLYEQRSRLQLLSLCLEAEENDLQNIGQLISNTNSLLENENDSLLKREAQMDKILNETVPYDETCISKNSVLCSLHKILGLGTETPYFYITPECLQEAALSLNNANCELDDKLQSVFHQHLQYMKAIENNSVFYDDLLYEKKWVSSIHPASLLQNITSDLNKGHLKLQDLERLIMKIISSYQMKQKMIQQNMTLKKARHLFVSALTNLSDFHQIISEIKLQVENTSLNKTCSSNH